MKNQVESTLPISQETAKILDFSAALGREVMICGGEMWRVEQMLNRIFEAYQLIETSIFMDIHTLIVSGRREGEAHVIRQIQIADINPEMERLTRLRRLSKDLHQNPIPAGELHQALETAIGQPTYTDHQQLLGLLVALLSINFIVGGGWQDALMALCGITIYRGCCNFFNRVPGTNQTVLHAAISFGVGLVLSLLTFRLGFRETPYMAIIVMAFGIIPGIPLINACREIFCGRVLCAVQLFMQSFVETAVSVAGFALAISLIRGW